MDIVKSMFLVARGNFWPPVLSIILQSTPNNSNLLGKSKNVQARRLLKQITRSKQMSTKIEIYVTPVAAKLT